MEFISFFTEKKKKKKKTRIVYHFDFSMRKQKHDSAVSILISPILDISSRIRLNRKKN